MAAARATRTAIENPNAIFWSDYYPENARVPRVDPGAK